MAPKKQISTPAHARTKTTTPRRGVHGAEPKTEAIVTADHEPTIIKSGKLCKHCGSWIPIERHGTYCPANEDGSDGK